jgi:hypothetical protein
MPKQTPRDNHTSLINPDHKLVVTINGLPYTFLGRDAMLARALINTSAPFLNPFDLIHAIGLTPSSSAYNSRERQALYKHINQLRKRVPGLLYSLNGGRGWRIASDQHPIIVYDSKAA